MYIRYFVLKDDLIIPETKPASETARQAKELTAHLDGLITQGEKYNKVVDVWSRCIDQVAEEMMGRIMSPEDGKTSILFG